MLGGDLRVGLVIRAVDQASSTIQQVRRNFNNAFAGMQKGAAEATKVWQKAGDLRNASEGLRTVQHALTSSVMGSTEAFGKFQTAMTDIRLNGGYTNETIKDVEKAMLDIGKSSTFGPTEAANAMLSLVKAGYSGEKAMGALKSTMSLAQSEGLSLDETAEILSDTLHQFGKESTYAGAAANALAAAANLSTTDVHGIAEAMKYVAPEAKKFGLTIEDTSAILAGLASKGLKGSIGGTSLDAFLKGLTGSSRIARREISKLRLDDGSKFQLFDPKTNDLKKPLDLINQFDEAVGNIKGTGLQARAVEKIFGDQGARAFENLRDMSKSGELKKLQDDLLAIQKTDLVGNKAKEKLGTYAGSVARFDASMETLKISVGRLGGSLAPLITDVADLVGKFADWTEKNPELTKGIGLTALALGGVAGALATLTSGFVFFLGAKGFVAFAQGLTGVGAAGTTAGVGTTAAAGGVTSLTASISAAAIPLLALVAIYESFSLVLDEVTKHWENLNNIGDWGKGFGGISNSFQDNMKATNGSPFLSAAMTAGEAFNPSALAGEIWGDDPSVGSDAPMAAHGGRPLRGDLKIEIDDRRVRVIPRNSDGGDFDFDVTNGPYMGGP